jgi:hypothetical protein
MTKADHPLLKVLPHQNEDPFSTKASSTAWNNARARMRRNLARTLTQFHSIFIRSIFSNAQETLSLLLPFYWCSHGVESIWVWQF